MNANKMADLTAAVAGRGRRISGEPGERSRGQGVIRRAVLLAACVAGSAAIVLGTAAAAGATVSQTSSQWEELGPLAYTSDQAAQVTAVYTIQSPVDYSTLLEDHGNQMDNGALTDVWGQTDQTTGQDPDGGPSITQANELWEFVPQSGNSGGQITTGYGELINRQSGLCLDVNGANSPGGLNYADGATIDQWQCVAGAANEQWTANFVSEPYGVGYEISSELSATNPDGDSNMLGIGNGAACDVAGDGDAVYSRTTPTACEIWQLFMASYDFATYQVPVSGGLFTSNPDGRAYECVSGYNMRGLALDPDTEGPDPIWNVDFDNISTGSVTVELGNPAGGGDVANESDRAHEDAAGVLNDTASDSSSSSELPADDIYYVLAAGSATGQVLLYCDPQSTTVPIPG
jgi:Ricin-type beta-trefoil lectin domain-like